MNMIERVARAIYESHEFVRPWDHPKTVSMWHRSCIASARAAIEAMREPTPKMQQVVSANWGRRTWAEYNEVIDAALQEPSK